MTFFLPTVLSVMLLTDPSEIVDASAAAAVSEDADRVEVPGGRRTAEVTSARVTSRSADFDRLEGVVMFEGDVVGRSDDFTICAEKLYAFLVGTNELSRIVTVGDVSITNGARVGTCAMATYRRAKGEIEMFGDGKANRLACLKETAASMRMLEGTRIRFWVESEQVEVENSRITAEGRGGSNFL